MSDTAKFRKALKAAKFNADGFIFNDKSKRTGIRRLKLWRAGAIEQASQYRQKKLEAKLREEFGDRIRVMYFIDANYFGSSLCIKLHN